MASVGENVLLQTGLTLGKLATNRTVRQVYEGKEFGLGEPEFPCIWFDHGPNISHEWVGIPGNDEEIFGQVLIRIIAVPDDQKKGRELQSIKQAVSNQVAADMADYRALSPPVYPTALSPINEVIEGLRDFAYATLSLRYHN